MRFACKNSFSLLVLGMALVCLGDLASSANDPQECSASQLQQSGDKLCEDKGFFAIPCQLVVEQFVQVFKAICSTSSIIAGGSSGEDSAELSSTVSPTTAAAPA